MIYWLPMNWRSSIKYARKQFPRWRRLKLCGYIIFTSMCCYVFLKWPDNSIFCKRQVLFVARFQNTHDKDSDHLNYCTGFAVRDHNDAMQVPKHILLLNNGSWLQHKSIKRLRLGVGIVCMLVKYLLLLLLLIFPALRTILQCIY